MKKQQLAKKPQFDSRFDSKRVSNGPVINNVLGTISPRGQKPLANNLLHVPSLSRVSGQDEPSSARRNVLAVAGRGSSMMNAPSQVPKAVNAKAKQMMKDVEDLYAGYIGKGSLYSKKDSEIIRKKKTDDSFVDDDFGNPKINPKLFYPETVTT